MKFWIVTLAMLLARALVAPAHAHKPSDSYLTLTVEGDRIDGQWDIALRDLDFALGLDANQDDAITWGEVKARHADIAAYALTRLRLGAATPCPAQVTGQLIDEHSDGAYAVLRFTAACAAAPKALAVGYRLFFDLDPQHRGLIRLEHGGKTRAGIFTADTPEQSFTLAEFSQMGTVRRLRQRGRLAHLDGLRPRPLPAVAAAAGGARAARAAPVRYAGSRPTTFARRSSTSSRS